MTDRLHDATWNAALEWFMRVRDAPADESVRADLDAWLSLDDAHRKAYWKATKVWKLTGALPALDEPAPAALPVRIRDRRVARFARPHLAALAAIVVLFAVSLPWLEIWLRADYHTAVGQTQTVPLADGSTVQLNANSAIAVDLDASRRSVRLLQGEAFFEIAPDATRPFTVNTPNATINVLGTAFNVRAHGGATDIAVERGIVSVTTSGVATSSRSPATSQRLTASDFMTIDATPRLASIAPQRIATWRDGRLIVERATAGDVVDALSSYRRGVILLAPNLRQRHVTGVYDLHRPDAAVQTLATSLSADVQFFTPWIVRIADHR